MKVSLRKNIKYVLPEKEYAFLDSKKEYTVYGIMSSKEQALQVLYYTCDEDKDDFPIARPYYLFDNVDDRISRYWIFGLIYELQPILIFPEWIKEPYFQEKLVDGEEREAKIFKAYKEAMNFEFPDSSISETAQIGDTTWLVCPICIDAWENKNCRDALVKCPNCLQILKNPRYTNEYPHL